MAQIEYVRAQKEGGVPESVPRKKYELLEDRYTLLAEPATDRGGNPLPPGEVTLSSEVPGKNASTDAWRAYARVHGPARGLSSEQVDDMSRDDIAGHFTEEN